MDSCGTSAGQTKEGKYENGQKWNRARLQTFKKPRLSSWVGLRRNSMSAFIPRLLWTVCGMYGGTKTEPEQRIKGSSSSFLCYYIGLRAALATKTLQKSWFHVKVNSRWTPGHKPHLFTFWYFTERFNTWAGLLHIWSIRFVKAACSGSLFVHHYRMDGISRVFKMSCDHWRTARLCCGPTTTEIIYQGPGFKPPSSVFHWFKYQPAQSGFSNGDISTQAAGLVGTHHHAQK